ncbi:uncharacterized protein LOC127703828 isoform X4 [Mytilus californianus]|uniref:uncharacterized protein LOC127703828 isoform X1 n=1 Tax=Mytilus californianus TaxID=6549 RepID=UPI0022458FDB|nr:uncharacterized protein LOC127703828 isoform X1 [Mytilus californianus]XP_052063864.1 uncharacterized protein LOC127703828 isoform X1 [Mytilus californianus]XP_052063865.1 uncharacterized protein LOC127703828 isoform X1 [Mytilus californianus]XP_052063866.1 uncharacterized protein LOC127703828 isoform X1 [Mytilus californianus]XP_052063870.1 uncharacterized protein LOC127703828 isoform X4 [Mytilus californianus]
MTSITSSNISNRNKLKKNHEFFQEYLHQLICYGCNICSVNNHCCFFFKLAVLKLVFSQELDIDTDQEKIRLIGRLLAVNPINIDNTKVCKFIEMSETHPAIILQRIISEYCKSNNIKLEDVLREEKHELYHKRIKTFSCCKCTIGCSTYNKVISGKQWDALYELNEDSDVHSCPLNLRICSERFVPKRIHTCNLSAAKVLILNIPNILKYMISRLYTSGFDTFLMLNQHTLYHSMKKNRCCKCKQISYENTEKSLITDREWTNLFNKSDISCLSISKDCCCQYSVRNGINYSDIDNICLSKIFHIAGPIAVLNKIEENAFLYFLNWTVDDKPLQRAITELSNILVDQTFRRRFLSVFSSQSATSIDARRWVSRNLHQQKATTEQQLQLLIRDEDGLRVKSVQIPKDFPLPHRTKQFTDLTREENNFLVVVYGLTKIVYPVIKDHFDRQCPHLVLNELRLESNEQQQTQHCRDENESRKSRIHSTKNQQQQLYVRNKNKSEKLDLKLMIHSLKRRAKDARQTEYVDQLNDIMNIQREIVQSNSGVLIDTRFQDILKCIRKTVLHFGGEFYEEKLRNLQHIKIF